MRGGWPPAAMSVARLVQSRARLALARHASNGWKSRGSPSANRWATNQLKALQPQNAPSSWPAAAANCSKERVRDAEREVEGGDANEASEQLVEQLLRGPARRVIGEQTRVNPDGVDAVSAPIGRVRGKCDDLPALVASAPGCAEVYTDNSVGGRHPPRGRNQGISPLSGRRLSVLPAKQRWERAAPDFAAVPAMGARIAAACKCCRCKQGLKLAYLFLLREWIE